MRLDKFICDSAAYSRSEMKRLIKNGAVTVNGIAAKRPDTAVSETDTVTVNGAEVRYAKFVYLMLNKPQGYVSATEDNIHPTVTELVPEKYAHYGVFPIGRLDIDTEGLLLLSNDGDFAHRVTSPKKNVQKRYFARLDKPAEAADIPLFAAGMELGGFTAKPARLQICDDPTEAYVEISEGKFHQVKRMFERVGKRVIFLKRVAIGGLLLPDDLETGMIREYEKSELEKLIMMQ